VVGAVSYGDADRIVTFLTRERGRLKGIARGAKRSRRRFGAALELFCKVRVRYAERPGAELARLEGCDLLDLYGGIRGDLGRLAAATYAAELAREASMPHQAAARLFELLDACLARLSAEPYDASALRCFEVQVLAALGWQPELGRCVRCGGPLAAEGTLAFSADEGGLLCARCGAGARGWHLSPGTVRTLRAALADERVAFTRAALRESEAPVARFLEVQLGKRLRSRAFLESMEG
jgi:DNA repair protein RecO (recombination protein O)